MTIKRHFAMENRDLDEVLAFLPDKKRHVATVMARLRSITAIRDGAKVLDIGAAAGTAVAALGQLGYRAHGVEPSDFARANAARLGKRLGVTLDIVPGNAENLPFADSEFDVVLANSVLEHVADLDRVLAETFRVLKPGGVFWFATASAMCPRQNEIGQFPFFGWYPDRLKRKIMHWAKVHKPHLVGHTDHPAIHWFTPWKARRVLRQVGFTKVYDRWDLRRGLASGPSQKLLLGIICSLPLGKLAADICISDCAYAAVK